MRFFPSAQHTRSIYDVKKAKDDVIEQKGIKAPSKLRLKGHRPMVKGSGNLCPEEL
ncbi:hypothetical protein GGD38_005526 [Chitinophagaceae bacterium OAS944]|nr:hypothetical protein [Chitinophagaceae bacterium OAS944]